MRTNYVARDGLCTVGQTTIWEYRPVFERGLWCVSRGYGGYDHVTSVEAKRIVGTALKKGEIWDRRRKTIKRG
jgi:hypothetical protein